MLLGKGTIYYNWFNYTKNYNEWNLDDYRSNLDQEWAGLCEPGATAFAAVSAPNIPKYSIYLTQILQWHFLYCPFFMPKIVRLSTAIDKISQTLKLF